MILGFRELRIECRGARALGLGMKGPGRELGLCEIEQKLKRSSPWRIAPLFRGAVCIQLPEGVIVYLHG